MTKQEKIKALETAMTVSKRADESEYTHFTDEAPEELKDLFLTHYEVRDIDYITFSRACDIVSEIYADKPEISKDDAEEDIYERASDSASPYNATRLEYLNIWNQDEVADYVRDLNVDISTAAAYWYDKQIEQSAVLINEWVNA
jgi:hypothetical protein